MKLIPSLLPCCIVALAVTSCSSDSADPPAASAPQASATTPAATDSAATTPLSSDPPASDPPASESPGSDPPASVPAPATSTFTSPLYSYSLTLPANWTATPAATVWDGITDPGHDEPTVDKMFGSVAAIAWGFAEPVTTDLETYAATRNAAEVTAHGCPAEPATSDPITIDGEPGLLQAKVCGILVMSATTIHNGTVYQLYMQDRYVKVPSDPDDLTLFQSMIASIDLPD